MTRLLIDVGNTRLKWRAHLPDGTTRGDACPLADLDTLDAAWRALPVRPTTAVGCCVAGDAVRVRVDALLECSLALAGRWITPGPQACGVRNGYDAPERLGADRWAALVGARRLAPGQSAVVVMCGTAVTVDALLPDGLFAGGLILPGFRLMLDALSRGTAGLARPAGEITGYPRRTEDALASGALDAVAGAVERMLRRLATDAGTEPVILAGGGDAFRLLEALPGARSAPDLVMDGLQALADETGAV